MLMPTPTPIMLLPPRSLGPQPLPVAARTAFDPVHGHWIDTDRPDDLDPRGCDPLSAMDDALAARGLGLRPWATGDAPALAVLLSDPAVWTHLPEPFPGPLDPEGAAGLIALANRLDRHIVRAVTHQGAVIGQVRLDLSPGGGTAELSYWLGRAFWGQGFGSALVAGAATRAFDRMALLRLVAKVRAENHASARVLARAGFRPLPQPPLPGFDDWVWKGLRRQDARPV